MIAKDIKTTEDVVRWLENYVEWNDEASRDMMLAAVEVLSPTQPIKCSRCGKLLSIHDHDSRYYLSTIHGEPCDKVEKTPEHEPWGLWCSGIGYADHWLLDDHDKRRVASGPKSWAEAEAKRRGAKYDVDEHIEARLLPTPVPSVVPMTPVRQRMTRARDLLVEIRRLIDEGDVSELVATSLVNRMDAVIEENT